MRRILAKTKRKRLDRIAKSLRSAESDLLWLRLETSGSSRDYLNKAKGDVATALYSIVYVQKMWDEQEVMFAKLGE